MNGSYTIKVTSKKIQYILKINRNISIIKGDSATGKTELCNILKDYLVNKIPTIKVEVLNKYNEIKNIPVRVLTQEDWEYRLDGIKNSIIFIDEDNEFVYSNRFAVKIKNSSNYFVIITRHNKRLDQLSYGINSIYKLVSQSKIINAKKYVINSNQNYYYQYTGNIKQFSKFDYFITEDSTSGFKFFQNILREKCISGNGKDNIINLLENNYEFKNKNIIINVDGCAFGAPFEKLLMLNKIKSNYLFYFYESFEWFLLNSIAFRNNIKILRIVENPEDSFNVEKNTSYEEFYYSELKEACSNLGYNYSKVSNGIPKCLLTYENYKWLLSKFYKEINLLYYLSNQNLNENNITNHLN